MVAAYNNVCSSLNGRWLIRVSDINHDPATGIVIYFIVFNRGKITVLFNINPLLFIAVNFIASDVDIFSVRQIN